ncbi:hypothetical protein BV25DRAFT_1790845, partial [Artomyces pyxidatus]
DGDDNALGDVSRRRLDESILPFSRGPDPADQLSGPLRDILRHKENYSREPKLARRSVLSAPDCPEFPHNLWRDVLAGNYVDLDRVYVGRYEINGDAEESHSLGSHTIRSNTFRFDGSVTELGSWITAWDSYANAVRFVYPSRERELQLYRDYISQLFAACPQHPDRVVRFDRAVRIRVGRSNRYLLSQAAEFHDLHTLHISNPVPAYGTGRNTQGSAAKASAPRTGRSNEVCRRFNDGKCTSRVCKFRHVCSNCGGHDHGAHSC